MGQAVEGDQMAETPIEMAEGTAVAKTLETELYPWHHILSGQTRSISAEDIFPDSSHQHRNRLSYRKHKPTLFILLQPLLRCRRLGLIHANTLQPNLPPIHKIFSRTAPEYRRVTRTHSLFQHHSISHFKHFSSWF